MTTVQPLSIWPPMPFNIYARRPQKRLPFPLEEPGCRIFSLARQGLFMGVKSLGLQPGDEVLVPAYNHGSEVEALVRVGISCRFYGAGPRLEPDEKDLEALLGTRVRALYLIHYLGLPQDAARWRTWCDEHGLLLIEDAAQAWLSSRGGTPVGSHGDLSIFCLYKTFALPDGAAVISNTPAEPPRSKGHVRIKHCVQRHGSYLSRRWRWAEELRHWLKGSGGQSPEHDGISPVHDVHSGRGGFALGVPGVPCPTTGFLLARVTDPVAQVKRAANYDLLLKRLERFVPDCFAHLPEGASPFAFPIQSEQKKDLLDWLTRNGILAADFWPDTHPCSSPVADFPRVAALRKSVVGLPVHQELGVRELEHVVDAVLYGLERFS